MMHYKRLFFSFLVCSFTFSHFAYSITRKQKEDLIKELTGKDYLSAAEIHAYSAVVGFYQSNDLKKLKTSTDQFVHRFPLSPFSDNALYLVGKLALEKNNYTTAIKYFSQIEQQYNSSNKNVSAQFAKAITYKKMNLPELAKSVFKNLKKQYPGSSEAILADSELRLLK